MTLSEAVAAARQHPETCNCEACVRVMDAASEHRYDCKCDACKFWWDRMPPEDDEDA